MKPGDGVAGPGGPATERPLDRLDVQRAGRDPCDREPVPLAPADAQSVLPDINDHPDDARRLIDLLADAKARINLMRWNPVLGGDTYQRIDDHGLTSFKRRLENGHLDVTVRDAQGRDIDAACGQLWLRDLSDRVNHRGLGPSTCGC